MIKDDQHSQSGDDPLALMRIRHLIAVSLVAALALVGVALLWTGLYIEHVYTWTGGIGCILSAVGLGVYAGQVDTARLTLQQQVVAASQGESRDARADRFEGVIIARLDEIADGVARIDRHQAAVRHRLDAAEIQLDRLGHLPAEVEDMSRRQGVLAKGLANLTEDELRKKRQARSS